MRLGLAGLPHDDLEWIVGSVQGRVNDLAESRILITGASGFVGRWMVASLIEVRRQLNVPRMIVDVLVRDPASARDRLGSELWSEVEVVEGDINSTWHVSRPVTHVVHGATPSSVRSGGAHQRDVLLTSVVGTHNLIHAVGDQGRPPRVLHLSSGAVYGPQPLSVERIPETWAGGPSPYLATSPYAEGKRAAEAQLEAASREGLVRSIQARLFAFLGPGIPTEEGFAVGNFAGHASRRQTIVVKGDGTTIRSYLEAKELASWLTLLLTMGRPGTPYNVGSPAGMSLRTWAEECASIAGVDVMVGNQQLGDRPSYVPDITNSQDVGLGPVATDSRRALEAWIEWLRCQP